MSHQWHISAGMCAKGRSVPLALLSPDATIVVFSTGDRIIAVPAGGGPERVVAVDPRPGPFAWVDAATIAYIAKDRICTVPVAGGPGRTVIQADGPITALAPSPVPDGRMAYIVDNKDVMVDGTRISDNADFAFDPAWSPDGATLAWHEWDVPNMPWDHSRIVTSAGATIAEGNVQQPRYSRHGRLAYLCDATGWLNVWVDGRPFLDEPFEHGGPAWGPGQRSFAWLSDDAIVLNRNEAGFGRLITTDGRELRRGVHRSITATPDGRVAAIRSGAKTPTQVVLDRTTLAVGPVGGFEPVLREPEPVAWQADDGATIHGRLFRAGDTPGPLLVDIHGGPTGQHEVVFDAKAAYWLDRGFSILVPDPRGSTGWGRDYQQALRGRWGELDVSDIAAGMRAAASTDNGWADPTRMVPIGTSSGGMAVLLLLALHPHLCRAGIASYPVSDLVDLARSTHRFEAHYNDSLVGPKRLQRERSPITHADRITAPLLVFHGLDDDVVPKRQTRALVRRLRSNGVDVEHVEYPGEGHGFRHPAVIEDQLQRAHAFLARTVLGFSE
jgi:dipeptidyl aminopeptidase/acylaminoacyl peptidase